MKPKVSVIIPVYKVEKYIHRCIDSVLDQTLRDIEVILVDDGSPDNCGVICDEYASKDARVKVIHKENAGVSSARNSGLQIATGEYIGFVDSDDYISETMFEFMYRQAVLADAEMSICHFTVTDGKHDSLSHQTEYADGKIIRFNPIKAFEVIADFSLPVQVAVWNKIYKRKLIQGLLFDTNKRMAEDLEFLMRALIKCTSVVYIPYPLYAYFAQREGAATFYGEHNIEWYLEQNENITVIMKEVADLSDGMKKLAVGYKCVNGDLSIANAMVRMGKLDLKVAGIVKHDLKENIVTVLKSELHLYKKMQILIFIFSPKLYMKMMKKKLIG